MSSAAIQPSHAAAGRSMPLRRRGPIMRIATTVLGRWGARLGGLWIALLIVTAVLAPLLANSHPILWKAWIHAGDPVEVNQAGVVFNSTTDPANPDRLLVISSPLLRYLSATDVTIFIGAIVLGAVLLLPIAAGVRAGLWLGLTLIGAVVCAMTISPPKVDVHSFYREKAAVGQVQWSIRTPLPYSPNDRQRDALGATGIDPRVQPPSSQHPLGTTSQGADVLSRMIHACRIALTIGLIATGIAASIGILVGGIMGYFAGRVDLIGMRAVEVFSSIPVIFLLIMIVAFYGRSLYLMTVILGLTGWVGYATFVRAEFLKIRNMDYITAARATGLPLHSILLRHMLPNGLTPVLVIASFGIASMILTESTLSFLGLGLVDDPSWGQMLNEARSASGQWGLVVFPGLAIFLTVMAYNLIGEALRDAIDPHSSEGQRA